MHVILRRIVCENRKFVRYKNGPDHWSVKKKAVQAVDKAWQHFDGFYKEVFTKDWESIKIGLNQNPKYVAVVNNYGDTEETIAKLENSGALNMRTLFNLEKQYAREKYNKIQRQKQLEKVWKMDEDLEKRVQNINSEESILSEENEREKTSESKINFSLDASLKEAKLDSSRLVDSRNALSAAILQEFIPASKIKGKEDWIPESDHYKYYENSEFPVRIEKEYDFHFPEHLHVYSYEYNNNTQYKSPKRGITGVLNYYLMDGGSVLPVLALDLKPGQKILDMCAAPGGKSMLALQTLYPETLIANDSSHSRVDRIYKVFKEYFYDLNERFLQTNKIKVTRKDGRNIPSDDYDRILVDVPCTTDRHSVTENDNNIFKPSRIKERLQLPEIQTELLVSALKNIKIGGVVVYSTCSLSPIQNDGVVHLALKRIWEETKIKIVVKDMTDALQQTHVLYKFADQSLMKYGHLVVPFAPLNFGPTYFCKLKRIK